MFLHFADEKGFKERIKTENHPQAWAQLIFGIYHLVLLQEPHGNYVHILLKLSQLHCSEAIITGWIMLRWNFFWMKHYY